MTVKDLIEQLSAFDQNKEVNFQLAIEMEEGTAICNSPDLNFEVYSDEALVVLGGELEDFFE